MAPKTDVIEQLRAQLAAAQEEIRRLEKIVLSAQNAAIENGAELKSTQDQLAKAEQLWQVAQGRCDGLEEKLANETAWQLIETAPKDGSFILLATPKGRIADGFWSLVYGVWSWPYVMVEPTHWMPMPKAPNGASS